MTAPSSVRRPLFRTGAAPAALPVLALVLALALAGCASKEDQPNDSGSSTTGSSPSDASSSSGETKKDQEGAGVNVEITFDGDSITPNGERVDVKLGEPVTLTINADAAGSIHVHSTPEQSIDFSQGTSTHRLTFDQPGLVEVESHDPAMVILQLEVR